MARWRLSTPYYVFTDRETEWEYKETDRLTGKQGRKVYRVPEYLESDTIVCWEGKGQNGDTILVGDPGPDMMPLDKEAEEISARLSVNWKHPIDSLPATGNFSEGLVESFQRQTAQLVAGIQQAVAPPKVSAEDFAALQAQVAELMKQNEELKRARRV